MKKAKRQYSDYIHLLMIILILLLYSYYEANRKNSLLEISFPVSGHFPDQSESLVGKKSDHPQ